MKRLPQALLFRIVLALSRLYLVGLLIWVLARVLLGDRWAWLFTINALALYIFAPLVLLLPAAWFLRRREIWLGLGLAILLWAYLWDVLFLPRLPYEGPAGERFVVMTYNLAGSHDPQAAVRTIRASGADVIGLNELNRATAAVIAQQLSAEYPHQVLDGRAGANGSGVLSRHPLRETGVAIPDEDWVSPPHILEIVVEGQTVTFVRFHAKAFPRHHAARERQARKLAAYARGQDGPLVMVGDLNASPTNSAYSALAGALEDSWREAGRGFGHTFPGADKVTQPGSARPEIFGVPVPQWLVRIDYIFHSRSIRTVRVQAGPWDGLSDHRAVLAELELKRR